MIPTVSGLLVMLVGAILYFKPPVQMLVFGCVCTLFPAAAAIDLPALGGSSIPPATLALGFIALRLFRRDVWGTVGPSLGLSKNAWLVVFCVYCAATAFVLPRLFAGRINLIPMGASGLGFVPLRVTPQNTTQAFYMLGTAFAAFAATALAVRQGAVDVLVKAFVVITWIHVLTGVADVAFSAAHITNGFAWARTGSYAQLDQGVGSLHRIAGMTPEPSVYAAQGAIYFIFLCELWLRRIWPRRTGPASLAMLVLLVLSTSSSAYIGIGAYALVLVLRAMIIPGSMSLDRAVILMAVSTLGLAGGLALMLAKPGATAEFGNVLAEMTIRKSQSASGVERSLWAKQGIMAMQVTHGLGVGVGSFRSSSIFTAILGSVGPAGLLVFAGFLIQVVKLGRRTSYAARVEPRAGAGAAAGWTALLALAPGAFTWASADPGVLFAIMAGLALAWRSGVIVEPRPRSAPATGPGLPLAPAA